MIVNIFSRNIYPYIWAVYISSVNNIYSKDKYLLVQFIKIRTLIKNRHMKKESYLVSNNIPSIKQLQCFLAVAYELSFRKAAERIRMTQPPLTRQIKCLEDVLGQKLFNRNTHDVSLTKAGKSLIIKAERIVEDIYDLKIEVPEKEKKLRIGLTKTLNFEMMDGVSDQLKKLGAEDDVDTPYLTSAELLQCIAKNSLDLALIGEKNINPEDLFQYSWVCREPVLIVLPSKHHASLKDKVSLNDVADLPLFWFSRSDNPLFYDKCEKVFSKLHTPIRRLRETEDSLAMLSHISRGKGIALMPQSKATFYQQGLCYRKLVDSEAKHICIDVYAVIRNDEKRESVLYAKNLLSKSMGE